jgi:hypothetical protein
MKKLLAGVVVFTVLAVADSARAQTWTEPTSGTAFEVKRDGMTLLGAGLRVKKIVFTFKAYAVALYVDDAALAGPLAAYKGKTSSPEFYKALQAGDFKKQVVLKFLRTLSQGKIQDAMRESLTGGDPATLNQFISYFPEVKEGQECVLRHAGGGKLESIMAGQAKPPLVSTDFVARLFGLYVGETPLQADIKAGVVARAADVLK